MKQHLLPDGQIATRTTRNPYTHVVCGVWSEARIIELRERAQKNVVKFSNPTNPREAKKLKRSREELSTYSAMTPGGHYVVSWETDPSEAEERRRKSQRHCRDELYVSAIIEP